MGKMREKADWAIKAERRSEARKKSRKREEKTLKIRVVKGTPSPFPRLDPVLFFLVAPTTHNGERKNQRELFTFSLKLKGKQNQLELVFPVQLHESRR